ncbi:MAG TPA: hypothetical protein VFA18_14085 [Gemmataceae bacterium]|nr:hypothetical protein [Gemmataceae bacterium]
MSGTVIPVQCTACGKRYNVAADLAGQPIVCRQCGEVFLAEPAAVGDAAADGSSPRSGNGRQVVLFGLVGIIFLAGICIFLAVHIRQQVRATREAELAARRAAVTEAGRADRAHSSSARPKSVSEKPVADLSAHDLWQAFGKNGMAADMAYRGKILIVRGSIRNIEADEKGNYFLGLDAVEPTASSPGDTEARSHWKTRWSREGYPPNVICFLDPARKLGFKALEAGNRVAVLGRCMGLKQDRQVYKGYVVTVEDCTLVTDAQTKPHTRAAP